MTEPSGPTPKLLLLDGHSLAYRAFFALREVEMSTTTGQPTNAVYGFTSMLINLLRDEEPTHVGVAFDVSRKTFRSESYAEYKAGRQETPSDFRGQVSLIKEVLEALRIPSLGVEGFEADDVIATLTTQAEAAGMSVLICTGDRDALQLVGPEVTVLYPKRGVSELTRFTPDEVESKYALTPAQYPDFAALRGDPSDNLPGIPGVGEKTASKWIREYGSLDALVDRVDEVRGKVGDALRAHLTSVLRNRQLTELVRDVSLPIGPDEMVRASWDRDEVHKLFDNLQFRVLRDRLFATLTAAQPEAEEGFDVEGHALGADELAGWLTEHGRSGARLGLSFRGTWGRGTGEITGVALAVEGGVGAYVDPATMTVADDAALAGWLADPDVPKAIHDLKGPLLAVHARGWQLAGVTSDTELAAYLALPGQRSFDLGDLALRYLHRELRSEEPETAQLSLDGGEEESDALMARGEIVRARAVADLAASLDDDLETRQATGLLRDLELPLSMVLTGMEEAGIATDADHLADLRSELAARVKEVEQDAFAYVGRDFNLGSPKQLQQILFEELGLPKTKRIKTGYTTDADSLAWLSEQSPDVELPAILLRHRDAARLKTVVESLIPMVDDAGRIHTTFGQTIAATGRLSSTDPNLQNIPIRTAEGRRIREAFVVGPGYELLMTVDYSQIEMRIMAHLSEDAGLIEAFATGEDLHTFVASKAFGSAARAGRPGAAPAGQGDVLRPRLRPVGVRPGQPAQDHPRRGPGPDDGVLRAVRRSPRLPARRRRGGPAGRLHRDHPRPPPLPARPHQRQPAAPRDGRADGAQRPDPGFGRRHHQGRNARRRQSAARARSCGPGCCCRCTTSSCSRSRRGSGSRSRRWSASRWVRRTELSVPLDVSVGVGRTWHDAGH